MNRTELLPILLDSLVASGVSLDPVALSSLAEELAKRLPEPPHHPGRRNWTRWTDDQRTQLVEMYQAGESVADIVRKLDVTRGSVYGYVTRMGLHRPPKVEDPE